MHVTLFAPTYNRLSKLTRMIESLEKQTFTSWDLIVVDDGSTDGTKEWLLETPSPKISSISFTENLGHPSALFNADICSLLKGEIVIFINSDDYFYEDTSLEKIVRKVVSSDQSVWKFGFLWVHENKLDQGIKHFDGLPDDSKFSSSVVCSDVYPESDFLFAYRKCYWDEFRKYFVSEDVWFSSFYDVALNSTYEEEITKQPVIVAGWGEDNITKGALPDSYFRWAMLHRKHMIDNYKGRLGARYLNYTLRSYLLAKYMYKYDMKDTVSYSNLSIQIGLEYLVTALIGYISILTPFPSFFKKLKQWIFQRRNER